MEKTYRWTIDVETDWGGRTNGIKGITDGIPRILDAFKKHNIRALFFISTELLRSLGRSEFKKILDQGHELGSHGHFHIIYRDRSRWLDDMRISQQLLSTLTGTQENRYRAPKFNRAVADEPYSYRNNHVSLLKHMWLGEKIKQNTIIYLHPFDIVNGKGAPNLFCRLWYSQPNRAFKTLERLIECYS